MGHGYQDLAMIVVQPNGRNVILAFISVLCEIMGGYLLHLCEIPDGEQIKV